MLLRWLVLGTVLAVGCGGKAVDGEPGATEAEVSSAPSGPPSKAPAPTPAGDTTTAGCASVRAAFDGADGKGPRQTLYLRTPHELREALQGYWFACEGGGGFFDTSRGEVGIVVDGDLVDTVAQKQDGRYVRDRSLGALVATDRMSFELTTGAHWAVFSTDGQRAIMGRSDLGSYESYFVRRESPVASP